MSDHIRATMRVDGLFVHLGDLCEALFELAQESTDGEVREILTTLALKLPEACDPRTFHVS